MVQHVYFDGLIEMGWTTPINSKWVFSIEGKIVNTVDVADLVGNEKTVTVDRVIDSRRR